MRLFSVLLLLCFTVGTISAFSLPGWLTSLFQNPVDVSTSKVCSYLTNNPTKAAKALAKIEEILGENNQTLHTFSTTLNYLNSQQNQLNLIGGPSTCPLFFSGLKDAIVTDLKNKNTNSASTQQQAMDIIINALNQLKALFS